MKEMRRVLALLLCFVMLVGYVPVGALAAEAETTAPSVAEEALVTEATDAVEDTTAAPEIETTASAETTEAVVETTAAVETTEAVEETTEAVEETAPAVMLTASSAAAAAVSGFLDAAIFCSDVHGSSSDLTSVMGGIKNSGVTYSAIGFVGDTCLTVAETESAVNSGLGYTPTVMFSYASSHDTADISTNWNYSGEVENVSDYYLVYTVRETDMKTDTGADEKFTTWYNSLTAKEKTLPIFIMSHRPLHDRRNDNAGAAGWYTAVSAAAETSDIVFFWAHNHTGESSEDTNAYYVPNDGSEKITVEGGSTVGLNFTYMNAGYINANNQNPDRIGVATTVQITADSLVFQDYNKSGEYNGDYSHNVTVTRNNAASTPTLESIAISGESSYTVGEELALTVTATYSDGSTKDVTADAELTGYDMDNAGTYTVTATFGGMNATYIIAVADPYVTGITVTAPTTVTYDQGDELDTTGMVVTATYNNGDTADITDSVTLSGYDMNTVGTQTVTVSYLAATGHTWTTSFEITVNEALADDVTLESMKITTGPTTTEYQVNDALDISGMVVTATFSDNTTKELTYGGSIGSDGTSTVASDTFCYYIDGFNMRVEKQQEVVVRYTYGDKTLTDTFVINVWNYEFKDETTGVIVDVADGDYGVTAVNVANSANTNVATAIADYITGTNYKAYDITLTLDSEDSYILTSDAKTVTLPIPKGVNNPVVCYVSDDGATVTNMNAVKDGNGKVTFTTTHFSTYVIGEGESTEIEVPENETASGSSTTGGKKTVYVLTSSITSGNSYLIVNGNSAGSYYALANNSGSVTATGVTVKTDDTIGTYIELDDATDELWTVASGYTFQNGSYYLGYTTSGNGWNQKYTFGLSTTSRSWSYSTSNHRLHTSIGDWNPTTYYLRYNDGWDWTSSNSTSGRSVYFYVPTLIDTTTTVEGTYTITGKDISAVVASDGSTTANLTATLTLMVHDNEDVDDVVTDVSTTATYKIVTVDANGNTVDGDPKKIITKIANGVVYFSGIYGTALVKVSYETDFGTVTDYITVTATAPYYSVELHKAELTEVSITEFAEGVTYYTYNSTTGNYQEATEYVEGTTYYTTPVKQGDQITSTIALKGIEAGDTYAVWAVVTEHTSTGDTDLGDLEDDLLYWTVSDESIATIDPATGVITFTGNNYGTFTVTVHYLDEDGERLCSDTITISATESLYVVPGDGTDDFPEYPNQGAVRFDKTATAVGNFSETGLAQVELSMTGVPYSTGNSLDVLLMLDMSTSMDTEVADGVDRVAVTITAAKAFAKTILVNDDGSFTGNYIAIKYFNGSKVYTTTDYITVTSDAELEALYKLIGALDTPSSSGTYYSVAMENAYNTIITRDAASTNTQALVFMSDGGPTYYTYVNGSSYATVSDPSTIVGWFDQTDTDSDGTVDTATAKSSFKQEYYSTLLKNAGYPVYTVGLGLSNNDKGPEAFTKLSSTIHEQITSYILAQMATSSSYFYNIADSDAVSSIGNVFSAIAASIKEAATDVVVEDKIGSDYNVQFQLPTNVGTDATDGLSEFYIQVVDYVLDTTTHERTGVYTVLENFTFNADGTLKSHTVDGVECSSCSHVTTTNGVITKIDGTYFDYEVKSDGEYLTWTSEKLSSTELALQYFVYLEKSAGYAAADQVAAGTYFTNEYATLTYVNVNSKTVQQEFPIPQLTWNGAQVSYVFYLVNENGEPVNRAGKVVPFAEAVYVTDVYTYSVVWNDLEQSAGLYADYLANDLVPDVYALYDDDASYLLHVYEDESAVNLNNHFVIGGDVTDDYNTKTNSWTNAKTTYVFNTKADATKYNTVGAYIANDGDDTTTTITYLCKGDGTVTATIGEATGVTESNFADSAYYTLNADGDYELAVVYSDSVTYYTITSASYTAASGETQAPANSMDSTTGGVVIDGYVYYIDENNAVYTIVQKTNGTEVHKGFDFSNTTVAFAVVWKPQLEADTVVVDYGLDVVIDVITNDGMAAGVVGVLNTPVSGTEMNYGTFDTATKKTSVDVYIDANNDDDGGLKELKIGTAKVENLNAVRFSLNKENGMQFTDPAVFYYEAGVNYYKDNVLQTTNMYSSVTVIPATTVYYEEDFVTLEVKGTAEWKTVGSVSSTTRDQDRPGASKITAALDADNVYGYDSAYSALSTYSNGAAKKVTVSKDNAGRAEFTFYGTGFDVISMTSSTTGTILVKVYAVDDAGNNTEKKSLIVDTYYGMDDEGKISINDPKALYQIPVMKVKDLDYGKYYVTITASYSESFDHTSAEGSYDFYLDAIRIFDPTGVASGVTTNDPDGVISDAYAADGESWPIYQELREMLIRASEYTVTENEDGTVTVTGEDLSGAIFIDCNDATTSIEDYVNHGPNNEVYLARNQAVSFSLDMSGYAKDVVADVQIGMKSADGSDVYVSLNGGSPATIKTATDMYYSIGNYVELYADSENGQDGKTTLTFKNTGDSGIVSITNLKITFKENPNGASVSSLMYTDSESAGIALMSLRSVAVEETPETETTEPEETEPEVTEPEVTEPEEALDAQLKVSVMNNSVKVGSTVVVKITTSSDVDALTVNGKEISRYTENRFTGVRTWTTTVKASEAGSMDIAVTAYNNGAALDTVTETIEVSGKTAGVIQQIVGQLIGMLFG